MRRDLAFLKESEFSESFRMIRGYDDELNLTTEDINNVTTGAGVYIIVAEDKTKFVYPKGTSSVIYIGKAENLQRRLKEHLKNLNNLKENEEEDLRNHIEHCPRYQYISYHGAHVYTFHCLKKTQDAKELESLVIWKFYEKYRALPVGNGARSFGK